MGPTHFSIGTLSGWGFQIDGFDEMVKIGQVLELSPEFVGEVQFNLVVLLQIDSFYHILEKPLMQDPPRKDYLSIYLLAISIINISGSEAGNVRYQGL